MPHSVLVTDFDGTMTANDFYKLATSRLLPPDVLSHWQDYREGKLTHFEALRNIFSQLRAPESALDELVRDMRPDSDVHTSVAGLRQAGWRIVVASAGCMWYIERVLAAAGLNIGHDLEVHANPSHYAPDTGLGMSMPEDSPYCCTETGVDKATIVRSFLAQGYRVAYAGDGFADLDAALLVPPELRFARADLMEALNARGATAKSFDRWRDVAQTLARLEPQD